MGVWIEIIMYNNMKYEETVAPFVGVWIEISFNSFVGACNTVAPFVGVWIEIYLKIQIDYNLKSLPLWECGLK